MTCSDVVFQGALLRYALRDADGGDFVAYLEASRHDPNAATNAATPNVAKDARRHLERGQNSIDRLPMTTGYDSSPSLTSARVSPK